MVMQGKQYTRAVEVDGIRFEDVHMMDLHREFGEYFQLWQYAKLTNAKLEDFTADIIEYFIIFDEAQREVSNAQ